MGLLELLVGLTLSVDAALCYSAGSANCRWFRNQIGLPSNGIFGRDSIVTGQSA